MRVSLGERNKSIVILFLKKKQMTRVGGVREVTAASTKCHAPLTDSRWVVLDTGGVTFIPGCLGQVCGLGCADRVTDSLH